MCKRKDNGNIRGIGTNKTTTSPPAGAMRPAGGGRGDGRVEAGYAALRQPRGGDKHWSQLSGVEQAAVMALGWTAASWDAGDEGPMQRAWGELGAAQTWAAGALGYKRTEFGRASSAAADEGGELGLSQEAADSEAPAVCPNPTDKIDRWLTDRGTGGPTLLFRAAQLACGLASAAVCAGTFLTPSLADAVEHRDPLLFGAVLAFALVLGPGVMLILADARRVCRYAGREALLPRLGAGTALLSAERNAGLKKFFDVVDPNGRYNWVGRIFWAAIIGPFIVMGWGFREPWQNRCTAATWLLWMLLAFIPAFHTWTATLHLATELIAAKIDTIEAALELELKTKRTDTSEEQWEVSVVEPVRELIRDQARLSDGWATGAVAMHVLSAFYTCAFICFALSPTLGPWAVEQSGLAWAGTALTGFCVAMAVGGLITPLQILAAPAALSTACDDLKEKLNEVRISDLSPDIDARLIILERAMANVNHGQGVGFNVLGIVIDKKMLTLMAARLYAAGSAAFTAILAYTAYAPDVSAGGSAQCELSSTQVSVVQSVLEGRNMSCAYNMTVDAVLGM